jgi:hypothetical protein
MAAIGKSECLLWVVMRRSQNGQKRSLTFLSIADVRDLDPTRLVSRLSNHCPYSDGTSGIMGAIKEPSAIVKILAHLSLSTRVPPRSTDAASRSFPGGVIAEAHCFCNRAKYRSRSALRQKPTAA